MNMLSRREIPDSPAWDRLNQVIASHPRVRDVAPPHVAQSVGFRTLQDPMRHASVSTTMIYLHVMKPPAAAAVGAGARSPLDFDGATE